MEISPWMIENLYSKCKLRWVWNKFYYDEGKRILSNFVKWRIYNISCSRNHGPGKKHGNGSEVGVWNTLMPPNDDEDHDNHNWPHQVESSSIISPDLTPMKCNTIVLCKSNGFPVTICNSTFYHNLTEPQVRKRTMMAWKIYSKIKNIKGV